MGEVVDLRGAVVADDEPVPDVVRLAHDLLEMAMTGKLRALAVATVEPGGEVGCEWSCTPPDKHFLSASVADLHFMVFQSRRERSDEIEPEDTA